MSPALLRTRVASAASRAAAPSRPGASAPHRRDWEQALREGEEKYQMLLDGIQDHAIFMLDPEGRVATWNAGAERIKGYTAKEIIGQDYSCFFPAVDVKLGRPAEILRLAAANGRHEEESIRVRKDGSRFLAHMTFTALRDPAGVLRGFSEFSHDLSESRDSEARYRGLLEAAPDAMVVVNQAGNIVLLNVRAEKEFGYRRDELVGQKVTNIIPEGFAERLIADGTRSAAEALAQQIGTGIELAALRKDGSEFPIEIMLSPLQSAEGILVTAAIRDISVRKAAETHLAQMEGRYRGLLEAAPDAMVVVNPAGEIVLLNVQAEKQFGYRRDELVGQKVTNIIPEGFAERLIADGTRSAAEALAQHIGTGIELAALRKDGSGFPIEIMLSPLQSAEGILVTAAIRDISVRKAAETHLAQMEERYRGLLEAAPDAMVVVNRAGEIVLLNAQAEKQFGYRRDELLGRKVTNIIPDGFAERLVADALRSAEDALAQQMGGGIELTGRRRNGSQFPIEIMLSPLASAEGILVTAAIRDITKRTAAAAQLMGKVDELNRSNEELGRFAAIAASANNELEAFAYSVSHDLRAPLRSLDGFSAVLLEDYADKLDDEGKDSLVRIRAASQRMGVLIDDMLALSLVTSSEMSPVRLDLTEMATDIVAELRQAEPLRQVEFVAAPGLFAVTDPHLMRIALANLLGNAWKFTGKRLRSRIEFGVKAHDGEQAYFVADNGAGFDMAHAAKLFGAFQRMHSTAEFPGTGIGLATVQRIVHRMGGEVWAEASPDHGATFYFALKPGGVA
jgi:PAS domain S-box-containing protein